ncbi:MAG: hypothetical protein HW410_36 [Nitrosarchaeum sp.]|nr:hypothetical protein [Nitrosarchaeum sp.]
MRELFRVKSKMENRIYSFPKIFFSRGSFQCPKFITQYQHQPKTEYIIEIH